MPSVLLAGVVVAQPKAEPFPERGRPRCEVRVKVEGNDTAVYRVVGHDDAIPALENLVAGDSVAIQGSLEIETKDGRLTGLFVIAGQVMALRRRSPNLFAV
jgi:hypothetical protein